MDKLSKETLEPIINEIIKSNDTNFKGVGQPLRIALTGSKFGPGIYDIITVSYTHLTLPTKRIV